ncbi:CFI-box-CTERM domain-containing protein [Mucilaginibacter sp.]|uniref:CFI-box-CTERM domain-containing protein n=1 Tax=Mucilaginibacter sp. TaxID=1882438 RepID=UPI0025D5C255|nr:CFI-box-CTERM domain-containing protein [Mucilaginibacter sp.]
MSKSRNDEAYDAGYEDGKNSHVIHRFAQSHSDIFPEQPGDSSYNGGFWDGAADRHDDDNSHYQGGSDDSSSDCFITTATLMSIGKSDPCEELNAFREFRDKWLLNKTDGQLLVSEYYKIAPRIVAAINALPDCGKIYNDLWKTDIEPCLGMIRKKHFNKAKSAYINAVAMLKLKYLTT